MNTDIKKIQCFLQLLQKFKANTILKYFKKKA